MALTDGGKPSELRRPLRTGALIPHADEVEVSGVGLVAQQSARLALRDGAPDGAGGAPEDLGQLTGLEVRPALRVAPCDGGEP